MNDPIESNPPVPEDGAGDPAVPSAQRCGLVAIVGKPNVGKSSLFNALAGSARAIVTPVAGTTRDLVTETVDLDGLRVTLVDSAGIRATEDAVEVVGVALARQAMQVSDVVLVVLDGSEPLDQADLAILEVDRPTPRERTHRRLARCVGAERGHALRPGHRRVQDD